MLVRSVPIKNRKRLLHMPVLFMTSLTQTAGQKMAALTVVLSRLSDVDFEQTGPEIEWKNCCASLKKNPVNRDRDASLPPL